MRFLILLIAAGLMAQPAQAQSSNAARYLLTENLAEACTQNEGTIDPSGLIEADLDGDGQDDLIIAHEGIRCEGDFVRSSFCGAQVCDVRIYLRRDGLLVQADYLLGGGVSVDQSTTPPTISGFSHGGGRWSLQWKGAEFALN